MEKTVELEVPLVLPGVDDGKDECLSRLEASLQDRRGILRAHVEREKTPAELCLHYDPTLLTLAEVRRIAARAGAQIVARYHHTSIPIEGMDCSDCSLVVEHSVKRLDGVVSASVNYAAETLWVEYDDHKVNRTLIEKRVRSLGYAVPRDGLQARLFEDRELMISLTAGLILLTGWLGGRVPGFPAGLQLGMYLTAFGLGGWHVSRHAWGALRERRFDTDLLMVVAAIGAAILGQIAEGALLLVLFSLGHALEERALDRARRAVRALADVAPKTALIRRGGIEQEVPVGTLQLGDVVVVRPGVRIPSDGVVLTGQSAVDQASVTGESLPVDKNPGDDVFAGTVNGESALEVKVNRLARDSTLARVMTMVEEAQAQKSPTQRTVEKFERVFVPGVLGLTLLTIIIPPLLGVPFRESFLRAMTLLVAASPCALALGTPAAALAGIAQAARNGVLVKGGAHLESLGRLKAVAFDKTGTLTHGRPEVTDIVPFAGQGREAILALAAGAESRSAHPLAQAVVRAARRQEVPAAVVEAIESLTGLGLRAVSNGRTIRIGSQRLMDEAGVTLSTEALRQGEALQQAGKTLMWIADGPSALGVIALADTLRPEAALTMQALKRLGVSRTIMLTGDNSRAASAMAAAVGVTDFRAELMPADKVAAVHALVEEFGQVAMVGDGVNDAPALANATVGIAMGGAGTDVALETADVALMGDDLSKLPFAVGLGRAARAVIVQNLAVSLGVIALLMAASLTGLVSIGLAVVFHEGSTLVVVANALRLLGYRQGEPSGSLL
jgi:Cd2+/Zn2+-exporting ATPase